MLQKSAKCLALREDEDTPQASVSKTFGLQAHVGEHAMFLFQRAYLGGMSNIFPTIGEGELHFGGKDRPCVLMVISQV